MAIPSRRSAPESVRANDRTFFVTSSIWGKRRLLQSDRSAGLLVEVLYDYRRQGKFRLHEFVVMPDHFHVLITVVAGMTIERAVQFIKGGFSFRAGRELGLKGEIWQRGFSEVRVLDSGSFLQHSVYIRENPVRARLVEKPEAFPFSSAYPGYDLDPPPQGLKPESVEALGGTPKGVP